MRSRALVCLILLVGQMQSFAQCAMCKAVVESGDQGLAAGVNDGIVYLMLFPYLLVAILAYALYRFKFKK